MKYIYFHGLGVVCDNLYVLCTAIVFDAFNSRK